MARVKKGVNAHKRQEERTRKENTENCGSRESTRARE